MPVVRSDETPFDMDDDDERRNPYRIPVKLDQEDPTPGPSNATGARLELESDTLLTDSWRQKAETLDESDYTRLRLDEDEESDELHMRTKYLFDEDKAMTPLKQMQATKELLTEGQRIAYVGLCYLVARRMVRDVGRGWEGHKVKFRDKVKGKGKGDIPVVESANLWILKIMARMFQHMELNRAGESSREDTEWDGKMQAHDLRRRTTHDRKPRRAWRGSLGPRSSPHDHSYGQESRVRSKGEGSSRRRGKFRRREGARAATSAIRGLIL